MVKVSSVIAWHSFIGLPWLRMTLDQWRTYGSFTGRHVEILVDTSDLHYAEQIVLKAGVRTLISHQLCYPRIGYQFWKMLQSFPATLNPPRPPRHNKRTSQVKSGFIYIAQYHKSQFASRGFTICPAYNTLCPWSLDSDEEKLPLPAQTDMQKMSSVQKKSATKSQRIQFWWQKCRL